MNISVVIPIYNEQDTLDEIIRQGRKDIDVISPSDTGLTGKRRGAFCPSLLGDLPVTARHVADPRDEEAAPFDQGAYRQPVALGVDGECQAVDRHDQLQGLPEGIRHVVHALDTGTRSPVHHEVEHAVVHLGAISRKRSRAEFDSDRPNRSDHRPAGGLARSHRSGRRAADDGNGEQQQDENAHGTRAGETRDKFDTPTLGHATGPIVSPHFQRFLKPGIPGQ